MTYNPKWLENSPDGQLGGLDGATGVDTLVPTQKAVKSFIYDLTSDVKDPSGIANRTSTALSYDTTSASDQCTVSIGPDTQDLLVYISGKKYVFDSAQTVVLADTEGLHYVYFNSSAILTETTIFDSRILTEWAFVTAVYWNATDKTVEYFGDERHGIDMAGSTHYNLHNSKGTVYLTGLALGDIIADSTSAIDADAQFSTTDGGILDEDLPISIPGQSAPATVPMYYLSGSGAYTRKATATNFPTINTIGTGRVAWNEFTGGAWQLSEATDNYFVLTHIFATNDMENPMVGVVGQNEYSTLTAARSGAEVEISDIVHGNLPFLEFVAVATIIFETSSSFGNTPKAIIRSTNSGGDYQDWLLSQLTPASGSPTDHGQLSGLADDDHLQYAILSGTRAFTGEQEFAAGIDVSGGDIIVANNTGVFVGVTEVITIGSNIQTVGVSGDTIISLTQSSNIIDFTAAGSSVGTFGVDGLTLENGTTINEFSTDTTMSGASNNAVPTEAAVKAYVDSSIGGSVNHNSTIGKQGGDATSNEFYHVTQAVYEGVYATGSLVGIGSASETNIQTDSSSNTVSADVSGTEVFLLEGNTQRLGISGSDYVTINSSTHEVVVGITTAQATFNSDGLTLSLGASVNEFSIDTTMADDSNDAVPTEHAVKTYVDNALANISTNMISEGDSYVLVNDATGGAGEIKIVVDGVEVGYYDAQATSQRLGKISSGNVTTSDTAITGNEKTIEVIYLDEATQRFGIISGTSFTMSQILHTHSFIANGTSVLSMSSAEQVLGDSTGSSSVIVNQSSDTVVIYGGYALSGTFSSTGLTLATGATINQFSTDVGLGTSNAIVPTQNAIKTYVDNAIGIENIRFVSSDTTAVSGDIVLVDSTAGPVNVELIESSYGKITIKKITNDSNTITIFTAPGLIDGQANVTIDTPYQAYGFISDSSNFYIIQSN